MPGATALPVRCSANRDSGMATSEYALVTVAACAFAAVLYAILTSSEIRALLTSMVIDALGIGG